MSDGKTLLFLLCGSVKSAEFPSHKTVKKNPKNSIFPEEEYHTMPH